ncbi:zinc finger protein 25-like isoform X1 [Uranotaenia lowii]|uniref:zinc finger protein 25-like isoform X1 n=1 Tax=Uranotaenia lowii TaxID=190385 RepID=UPI0024787752|nr:zinc finger protein 25-like isoform X1 [Uranotaenia lowii]
MKTCRTCLSQTDDHMVSLFAKTNEHLLADIISQICSVTIIVNDGFPAKICKKCVEKVDQLVDFINLVKSSDAKLKQPTHSSVNSSIFEEVSIKSEIDENEIKIGESYTEITNLPSLCPLVPEVATITNENLKQRRCKTVNLEKSAEKISPAKEVTKIKSEPSLDDTIDNGSSNDTEDGTFSQTSGEPRTKRKGRSAKLTTTKEPITKKINNRKETQDKNLEDMYNTIDLPKKNFLCCYCFDHFDAQEDYLMHVEVHRKHNNPNMNQPHSCDICKRKFKKDVGLERHRKKFQEADKLYECVKCSSKFMNKPGLRLHILLHHSTKNTSEQEIMCCAQSCSKTFETEDALRNHAQDAHKFNKIAYQQSDAAKNPIECPICYKRFPSQFRFRCHKKRNSKPMKHQCFTCGLKFRTAEVLSIHEINHGKTKPFVCAIWEKPFASKSFLNAHLRTHNNDKRFACAVCDRRFFQKAQLKAHEIDHNSEPLPFNCEHCDKSFKCKAYLVNHMRRHTGEKPFPCRHCSMTFANGTTRQRHEMNHTGDKPFQCSYCDEKFTVKRMKLEHECKHTVLSRLNVTSVIKALWGRSLIT